MIQDICDAAEGWGGSVFDYQITYGSMTGVASSAAGSGSANCVSGFQQIFDQCMLNSGGVAPGYAPYGSGQWSDGKETYQLIFDQQNACCSLCPGSYPFVTVSYSACVC